MKNEHILKKVIEKACNKGYKIEQRAFDHLMNLDLSRKDFPYVGKSLEYYMLNKHYYSFIFSHDFAKAFWGEKIEEDDLKILCKKCGKRMYVYEELGSSRWYTWFRCQCGNHLGEKRTQEIIKKAKLSEGWRYHLQQMIVEKKPLKYLERFL